MKTLYRSDKNKILAGILGGLGEYYSVDPVLLRAGYILLTAITGFVPGFAAYVLCIFIIPTHHEHKKHVHTETTKE